MQASADGGIVIVGGGFAGVWAAAAASARARERHATDGAADADAPVTLISAGDCLVIRPRLYESAPQRMQVPLDGVLGPVGVRHVLATVTEVDAEANRVDYLRPDGSRGELAFARLILATGSRTMRPDIPGSGHLFDIDRLPTAARLERHLHALADRPSGPAHDTVVVVGGGFAGIELATALPARLQAITPGRRRRVVLVEARGPIR